MAKNKGKVPKAPAIAPGLGIPPTKRVPAKAGPQPDGEHAPMILRFDRCDVGSEWSLIHATADHLLRILNAVKSFESMTAMEVYSSARGKRYVISDLPNKQARDRLALLGYDDQDYVCGLRLNGPGRLFGIQLGRFFHVLWWDPNHDIWPSEKKHT